jgi:PIN domain nuclease of toxin-antitoxin system
VGGGALRLLLDTRLLLWWLDAPGGPAPRLSAAQTRAPADQLIVATARVHGLRLVTSDERIRRSDTVSVI